ncbi:MAG TPA: hypothetical protein VFE32_03495 [Puia sp.]|jgi:hypothetical protein|nr:hypothetical protein [Puia sp.]
MAINQNHLFEELNGVKCAIVEKNVVAERVEFLRGILEYNGYTVVVVGSPPPKGAGAAGAAAQGVAAGGAAANVAAVPPATFTVGVTDVMFNAVNAIFGRLLKMPGGHVVTLAYWQEREGEPDDERPYFEGR